MSTSIHADIVSMSGSIFSGSVQLLVAPATEGEIGIMHGHIPLLTNLVPGDIRLTLENGEEQILFTNGGLLEVQPKIVTILSDTVARAEDLDEKIAQEAIEAARQEMAKAGGDANYAVLATRIAEMTAQLKVIEKVRKMAGRR